MLGPAAAAAWLLLLPLTQLQALGSMGGQLGLSWGPSFLMPLCNELCMLNALAMRTRRSEGSYHTSACVCMCEMVKQLTAQERRSWQPYTAPNIHTSTQTMSINSMRVLSSTSVKAARPTLVCHAVPVAARRAVLLGTLLLPAAPAFTMILVGI